MTVNRPPYPPDHYIGVALAAMTDDEAAAYILAKAQPVDPAPGCNCPHCAKTREAQRLTRVQPAALTARQIVGYHVANAVHADPRFRGDVEWAKGYLAECVRIGWLTEAEANEIRVEVGWPVTAVQMRMEI